ncbi:hypothetical protein N7539_003486 [Penicillium diatomitis]|uniref:Proline dehydrogenase n=1 Tax=Penicillium diatomitis TaxID=2819901 RepID=A0A9W9XCF1_9EURO|nr:uncharacterized protein N7539_003486 [Penicillium diatomitis]KAJ5488596.1 hypothetical protein N7539_003486 [Penicillium diatomitis]
MSMRSVTIHQSRCRSDSTKQKFHSVTFSSEATQLERPAMSRLPTARLIRSLILTSLMSSKLFLRPALGLLKLVTHSKSGVFDPDRNWILNKFLRWTVYDHFCAGTNRNEVAKTIARVKSMGFQGVILGYSKEIVIDPDIPTSTHDINLALHSSQDDRAIEEWKDKTLETLRMVGSGDFLAMKLTGAGPLAVRLMKERQPMPTIIATAVDVICKEAQKQGSRLWLDAEQQVLQHGLDDWAIEMMRKYNRSPHPLVYNTIQAYLKGSTANLDRHLLSATQEGWSVGIKLVRGAYIEHETRSLIHDCKEDTDRSYDFLANRILCRVMPDHGNHLAFPDAALFLATHNAESASKAISVHRNCLMSGQPTVSLDCGQIQGMADELGCELAQNYERACRQDRDGDVTFPKTFKCMAWGSVGECLQYLHRRAIENKGAVERTEHMLQALRKELRRRLLGF